MGWSVYGPCFLCCVFSAFILETHCCLHCVLWRPMVSCWKTLKKLSVSSRFPCCYRNSVPIPPPSPQSVLLSRQKEPQDMFKILFCRLWALLSALFWRYKCAHCERHAKSERESKWKCVEGRWKLCEASECSSLELTRASYKFHLPFPCNWV